MLRYTPNKFRVHSRFAVIVSKKVLKAAAKRNRVRRRVYEIIRHHSDEFVQGYDYSITVFSPEVMTMPASDLEREVLELFRHIRPAAPAPSDK